jgi:outer membrane protein TolC
VVQFFHLLSCVVLSAFFSITAFAAPLTLKSAVEEGLQNSPVVQKSESVYRETKWKKREAWSHFLPSVTGSINYLTMQRYMFLDVNFGGGPISVPQIAPTVNFVLNAQLPLFEGGAGLNRYWAGRAFEASASDDYLWTQFKVAREILLQYYRTIAAVSLKEVAEQNMKALSDHLHDVRLFKKAGMVTNFDVLKVEVQESEARSELLSRLDNIVLERNHLNEMMGLDNDNREISGSLPILKEEFLKDKKLALTSTRHDLSSLINKVEGMRQLDSAAGRFWVPRINAIGQYQYYNNKSQSFSERDDYRDAYLAGFQLTWNLFDGMASIAQSQEAAEQYYQTERTLRLTRIRSAQEIEVWKRKYIYQCNVFHSRQDDVEKATESVRLAQQGRKVGTRTNSDLLDAENELYRARAGLVNAQIGSVEALINLELATGQEIHNFF